MLPEENRRPVLKLGAWEIAVLRELTNNGEELPSKELKRLLCEKYPAKYCSDMVKYAVRKLKRKGLVRHIRRRNVWIVKLTREGKKFLLNLIGEL